MAAPGRLSFGSFATTLFVVVPVGLVVLASACGSRGPLDDDGPLVSSTDAAAADDGPTTSDAETDAGLDAMPIRDSGADAGSEGGVVACGSCVITSCGTSILMCLQDTACRTTLQCVTTTCLSGGSPNLACVVSCAAGDLSGALQIFQVFQCITGTCGSECTSVLGGLGGGLGGP